jgi:hypothetical protein
LEEHLGGGTGGLEIKADAVLCVIPAGVMEDATEVLDGGGFEIAWMVEGTGDFVPEGEGVLEGIGWEGEVVTFGGTGGDGEDFEALGCGGGGELELDIGHRCPFF